jgi:hypothetical protein
VGVKQRDTRARAGRRSRMESAVRPGSGPSGRVPDGPPDALLDGSCAPPPGAPPGTPLSRNPGCWAGLLLAGLATWLRRLPADWDEPLALRLARALAEHPVRTGLAFALAWYGLTGRPGGCRAGRPPFQGL